MNIEKFHKEKNIMTISYENRKEYFKQYREKNKERQKKLTKAWRDKNSEQQKTYRIKYREENKKTLNAKDKKRYYENIEATKLKRKNKYWNNKDKNPEKIMFQSAKDRAKRKGIEFNITLEDISIPTHCPVLKIPLTRANGRMHDNSPSLDRIDCTKGYIKDNIIVISWKVNRIKSNASLDELMKIGMFFKSKIDNIKQQEHTYGYYE